MHLHREVESLHGRVMDVCQHGEAGAPPSEAGGTAVVHLSFAGEWAPNRSGASQGAWQVRMPCVSECRAAAEPLRCLRAEIHAPSEQGLVNAVPGSGAPGLRAPGSRGSSLLFGLRSRLRGLGLREAAAFACTLHGSGSPGRRSRSRGFRTLLSQVQPPPWSRNNLRGAEQRRAPGAPQTETPKC